MATPTNLSNSLLVEQRKKKQWIYGILIAFIYITALSYLFMHYHTDSFKFEFIRDIQRGDSSFNDIGRYGLFGIISLIVLVIRRGNPGFDPAVYKQIRGAIKTPNRPHSNYYSGLSPFEEDADTGGVSWVDNSLSVGKYSLICYITLITLLFPFHAAVDGTKNNRGLTSLPYYSNDFFISLGYFDYVLDAPITHEYEQVIKYRNDLSLGYGQEETYKVTGFQPYVYYYWRADLILLWVVAIYYAWQIEKLDEQNKRIGTSNKLKEIYPNLGDYLDKPPTK